VFSSLRPRFDGVECSLGDMGQSFADRLEFMQALKKRNLSHICGVYTSWVDYEGAWTDSSVSGHLTNYRKQLLCVQREILPHTCTLHINAHSGQDTWSLEQHEEFFRGALAMESELGLTVSHETHRGRSLFNPWITLHLIRKFPTLKITADYSHWVVVAERLLTSKQDEELLRTACDRVQHIHARVGHAQAAQVADPRDPRFATELSAHQQWWHSIWLSQRRRLLPYCTATPEYGPIPYTPALPYTGMPVVNLDDVVEWQADSLRSQFAHCI